MNTENLIYDSYSKALHNIIIAMDQHLLKLSEKLERLDRVIQPYKWSNKSAGEIQHLFEEMNSIMDDAEKWVATKAMLVEGGREIQKTNLKFQIPCEGPNKRCWEAVSCFYIDKLTKAMIEDNKEDYESAIMDLIDVGRAYDRELDPDTDPYELLDDSNRARSIYGDLYDDGFNSKDKEMITRYEKAPILYRCERCGIRRENEVEAGGNWSKDDGRFCEDCYDSLQIEKAETASAQETQTQTIIPSIALGQDVENIHEMMQNGLFH